MCQHVFDKSKRKSYIYISKLFPTLLFLIYYKMRFTVSSIITIANLIISTLADDSNPYLENYNYPLKAIAVISNDSHNVTGTVRFTQEHHHGPTEVVVNITGLEPGTKHGLHVHQFGDLSGGCETLGEHYNPFNESHGGPTSQIRHVGDFGNVEQQDGPATLTLKIATLQLAGATSVVGRSVVLHSGEDDLGLGNSPLSKTTGNSGARLACGIIGRK